MSTVQNLPPQQTAAPQRSVRPQSRPVARDNTRVATPQVKIDSSNLSTGAAKTNPFSSFAPTSTSVKVDGWKKGKNDSLEGILKNQGYSLSEIYTKDSNGKTMIDKVAAANDLRNPNVIQPGQKLNVPSKEKSESVSSMDLGNGHSQSANVNSGEVSIDTTMSKDKNGNISATTSTDAGDASISSQTQVGEGGRADTAVYQEGDAVKAQTVAMNSNGSAVSQVDTQTEPGASSVTVKDIDRDRNLNIAADADNVAVTNPGTGEAGDVTTNVDISEASSDGWFENAGRGITNWFTGNKGDNARIEAEGASAVTASKNDNGQATVRATINGEEKTLLETAGDTDDSWLERAGEGVDNFFGGIGDWFSGGEGTSKSDVTKQTRRGRRRVR